VAQEESRRTGERVSNTWKHITAQGWRKVGSAGWGYVWRDATDAERRQSAPKLVLERDPQCEWAVNEAFRMAGDGATVHKVARWAAALPASARGNRALSYPVIRAVLRSPLYIARGMTDPAVPATEVMASPVCRWPALVDDETWLRAQEHIASHQRTPRQATGRYLLTGIIHCPRCGARMAGGQERTHGRRYYCKGAVMGGANAPDIRCTTTVTAEHVESAVLHEMMDLLGAIATNPAIERGLRLVWAELRRRPKAADEVQRQARQFEATIERARQRIQRATDLFVDGELDKAEYDAKCARERRNIESAEQELSRLRIVDLTPELPPIDAVLALARDWCAVIGGLDVPAQRRLLMPFVERVVPIRLRPGKYRPDFGWTTTGSAVVDAVRRLRAASTAP
jgi:hypothetical protein